MELKDIKGLSDKRIEDLNKMEIFTPEDLIAHFPRNYLDLTRITPVSECYHNDFALVLGKIINKPQSAFSGRRVRYVKAAAEQGMEVFTIIWFNQPYVLKQIEEGREYLFYGRIQNKFGSVSVVNPSFEPLDKNYRLKGIVPVYSLKGCLTQKIMRDAIKSVLSEIPLNSDIPDNLRIKYNIDDLKSAYIIVHNPQNFKEKQIASERIALEEYFKTICSYKLIKGDRRQVRINTYNCSADELKNFTARFGFDFTDGQKNAVNDIYADMTSPFNMNRLLQGDVGSGKTAVSLCALFMAVKSGYQAVMLAPTEILAEQDMNVIKKYIPEAETAFLSGSLSAKEKRIVKEEISSGEAKIVVGTHAVLQENVEFKNLCMCVCDEQHRFGVAQRSALLSKGSVPDVLVMSATPIPRTLSLIFYGDLDISTIRDKPKARAEIQTFIVPYSKYDGMMNFIKDKIKDGEQVYFVCPKIEEDEEGSLISVKELYSEVVLHLEHAKVALLHGKMKDGEKTETMRRFKAHEIDALVSTTVIEVGIDVASATVMVIYNAERFGLSQLHQLRGRVGRGDKKSYCFLLSESENDKSKERLSILKDSTDGFDISEKDYDLRGSGDLMGNRQSGKFVGKLGSLVYPSSVIFYAKKLSDEAFEDDRNLSKIRAFADKKYESLKDVALN